MSILEGKRVAFTGQLASMTRPEAADLVRAQGGTFVTSVTRTTSHLIVGQDGWPLRKDGSLSDKLQTAQKLQAAGVSIAILTEEELLERLGMEGADSGIHTRFTLAQLVRILKVPRNRLRAWLKAELLKPVETIHGVCYFDFHQVTGIRTLCELTQAGVTAQTIRASLEQLRGWLPSLEASLEQLNLLERNGQLLMRLGEGGLADASGQRHFDFDSTEDEQSAVVDAAPSTSAESWWEKGCALEEAGQLHEAADAYRAALYHGGPDANICFNLANVLFELGSFGQAAERYRQVVELDHQHAEAWNNLGNTLLELGQTEDAFTSYEQAIRVAPSFAGAHYNLADALEQQGRFSEARPHWKEYLRHESVGAWADYARRRLAN